MGAKAHGAKLLGDDRSFGYQARLQLPREGREGELPSHFERPRCSCCAQRRVLSLRKQQAFVSDRRFVQSPQTVEQLDTSSSSLQGSSASTPFLNITAKENKYKKYKRHSERFPPNDGFHFDIPRLKYLTKNSLYAIRWGYNHVFGSVSMLDLFNTNQVASLFRNPKPKCIFFVHEDIDLNSNFGINWWLQPLAKKYSQHIKVYTGTKKDSSNAWGSFGLTEADLPIAVMHDTQAERKAVMKKGEMLTADNVEIFWKNFLGIDDDEIEIEAEL